jgi:HEAT repeat protein
MTTQRAGFAISLRTWLLASIALGAVAGIALRICQALDAAARNSAVVTFQAFAEALETYEVQRDLAVRALGSDACDEVGKLSVARLTKILTNGAVNDRRIAALLLGACDRAAQETAPDLENALSDSDPLVRYHVANALKRIAASETWVIAALQRVASTDPDEQVRAIALAAVPHDLE